MKFRSFFTADRKKLMLARILPIGLRSKLTPLRLAFGVSVLVFAVIGTILTFSGRAVSQLTWAPPDGWKNYTQVVIPASGGTVNLASNIDYKLVAPNVVTEALHIRGGRNVVWIGGHISINNKAANATGTQRRALVLSDATDGSSVDGRVVHIEGIRIDGNDLSEGINFNAPKTNFVLQNIGGDTIRIRGFDDRDGTGAYSGASHPDWIQPWGGAKSIKIDGLSGKTNYQGFFLSAPATAKPNIWLKRINLEAVELPDEYGTYSEAGHSLFTWFGDTTGQVRIDNGTVWFKHHSNSGWDGQTGGFKKVAYRDGSGNVVQQPVGGNAPLNENIRGGKNYPSTGPSPYHPPQQASDSVGAYVYWPATATLSSGSIAVSDWVGSLPGRFYSGLPSTGSYVPLASVGISYVSPGYVGDSDTIPPTPPSNLTATAQSPSQINLSWTASTDSFGVTGYDIYRGADKVGTVTTTSYSDTSLVASTTYSYSVVARDAAGNLSQASATVQATTTSISAVNLAAGKLPTTSSASSTNLSYITNSNTTTSQYATLSSGAQWVKLDLGESYFLNRIKLWHYYGGSRAYRDVIVQVSNDVNFKSDVTTVFNNDSNNSAGQGIGSDSEYIETSAGKELTFGPVNTRYVRLWSNGSTSNAFNHYVEVEVYTDTSSPPPSSSDTVRPVVSILSPTDGSTAGRGVGVRATATDNVKVTKMEIYINNTLAATSASGSISYSWNTRKLAKGTYPILVLGYDATGNIGQSSILVHK